MCEALLAKADFWLAQAHCFVMHATGASCRNMAITMLIAEDGLCEAMND